MRCNWRRWLWGLIPLVMVSWAAVVVERGRIEQDLSQRARQALAEEDSAWANVAFKGRDANLSGRAVQDSQPITAEKTVRKVWGVRDVDNNAALPPKVEPFQWAARRKGNRVRIFGYVPNRATRQTIIGMANAALPGFDVNDRMSTARGVPPVDTWLAGLNFAMKQLALLKRGEVRLEGLALTISGEADDAEAYRNLNAAVKGGLPKGITLASAQITAPVASPFVWSVQFAGGQIILSGHVPGETARAELLAAAKAGTAGTTIIDRMELAEGAPQDWSSAAIAVVKHLMRLQSGEAEIKDSAVTASGIAADEASARTVRTALRASIPAAFKLTHQIGVREPPPPPPAPKAEAPIAPLPQAQPAPQAPEPPSAAAAAPVPFPPLPMPPPIPPARDLAPVSPPQPSAPPVATPPPAPKAEPAPKTAAAQPPPSPAPAAPTPKTSEALPPAPARQPPVDACESDLGKVGSSGHIFFDSNSAALDPASHALLDQLAAAAKSCTGLRIAIEGHTDAEGSARYNRRLSVRRARAVRSYLVNAGTDAKQLGAIGYGFARPVAPNDTAENMARNRRIEFVIRRQ